MLLDRWKNDVPTLHAVDLEVHPPYSSQAQQRPQQNIFDCTAYRQPFNDTKVEDREPGYERYAAEKEDGVDWRPCKAYWRRRHRQEGRYSRTCIINQLMRMNSLSRKEGIPLSRNWLYFSIAWCFHMTRGAIVP